MIWEIWDMKSRNILATFEAEDDALDLLSGLLDDDYEEEINLLLATEDDAGHSHRVASGEELVKFVRDRRWP